MNAAGSEHVAVSQKPGARRFPRFDRRFLPGGTAFTCVGRGALGGKAGGLALIQGRMLPALRRSSLTKCQVSVPTMAVLTTTVFDAFMARNGLARLPCGDLSDQAIAHAFQQADLPAELLGDLRALAIAANVPLAVRSSSLLEDAVAHPFAGVYATKLIANSQPSPDERFHSLLEAIKFVYASTFFSSARNYRRAAGATEAEEKMAVIVQEVVGSRYGNLFYPAISGVARSHNYYPVRPSRPEDGVVSLALGLGKTIVDGGACWTYSPRRPAAPPPLASSHASLKETQTGFWAVDMGRVAYDPVKETEYLRYCSLTEAERGGVLGYLASTYDTEADRLCPGTSRPGPRVLDFAPVLALDLLPLNDCLKAMLAAARDCAGSDVEIEFAASLQARPQPSLEVGFLQVRPVADAGCRVDIDGEELDQERVVAASEASLGNGAPAGVRDIVYVKPDRFCPSQTSTIAEEVAALDRGLVGSHTPYVLIGFGRWGTSDPWLGIPVDWGQISGVRVLVEATAPGMPAELSQGSHFFHNLISRDVLYLSVPPDAGRTIDWVWLDGQETVEETDHVCHVRTRAPLDIRVDGRSRRGVIAHG